jgi:hypothetical protein
VSGEYSDEEMREGLRAYTRQRRTGGRKPMTPAETAAYRAYKRVSQLRHQYLVVKGLDAIPEESLDRALSKEVHPVGQG